MQTLFISYHSILRDNGLSLVLENSQRVAVQLVLHAVRPVTLRGRLTDNLESAKYEIRKDFKGFMRHAIKLTEAFQIVDNGRKREANSNTGPRTESARGGGTTETKVIGKLAASSKTKTGKGTTTVSL